MKNIRKFIAITIVAAAFFSEASLDRPAVTFYVSPDGSVSNQSTKAVSVKTPQKPIELAGRVRVLEVDSWHGFRRTVFEFKGCRAWIVEPQKDVAEGAPWTWTMQWADAFVERTGVLDLLARGWRHVTIETFKYRMNAEGLRISREFQKFLVDELGFAPKANLVGMSWGGFFSVRYASAYPDAVARIYLDAPLLTFTRFGGELREVIAKKIGPWSSEIPSDGDWSKNPEMPINKAEAIAKARIPVLLLYGGRDTVVVPELNCRPFIKRFKAAGGEISVVERPEFGHHPHGESPERISSITRFFNS